MCLGHCISHHGSIRDIVNSLIRGIGVFPMGPLDQSHGKMVVPLISQEWDHLCILDKTGSVGCHLLLYL